MIELPDDKPAARSMVRARRRARRERTTPTEREQAAAALRDHLAPLLDALPVGARVASFESRPAEPPTHLLHEDVRRRGLDLIVPVVLADLDLDWRRLEESEPLGRDAASAAQLMVMPALAVATDGMRLGQGGGCYDRVLTRVGPEVRLVAVVHDDELVDRVPTDPHDRPVHAVLTPGAGLRTLG